ncbi:MAG TPA: 4Fe-4S dicluster domain-containing protein [Dissulfurispiraceae bacterium]|nr:4Fe-4S dicluster domain-containing protein [Dissulfurispiraceae bacterium]
MSINRREFIKLAGISTILGIGGTAGLFELHHPAEALQQLQHMKDPNALTAKRWAMVIDSRKFKADEDYRRCTDACHKAHNVPDIGNPKDEIKWIWKETFEHAFPGQEHQYFAEDLKHKPFLVLCNHCDNPPCVRVCPTKATFKRPDGIVVMDPHRCIGCRFCMAGCPFGARSFNFKDPRPFVKQINPEFPARTKGVVEKCTFCHERLAKGLRPACVEASNGAILFGDLKDENSEVRKALSENYSIRRKSEVGTQPSVFYII